MSKKKKKVPHPWESAEPYSEKFFAMIYESMLCSDAWKSLSANQKALYITCKSQGFKQNEKKDFDDDVKENPRYFTMNRHKYVKVYRLYNDNNQNGFIRDMDALIEHGFVECVISGKATRTKSLYRFSQMWVNYGTDSFYIDPRFRTTSGNKKYNS